MSSSGFRRNRPRTMSLLKFSSTANRSISSTWYDEPTDGCARRVGQTGIHFACVPHWLAVVADANTPRPLGVGVDSSRSRHTHRPDAGTDTAERSPQRLHLHQRRLQSCQASRAFGQLARHHQHLFSAGLARLQSKNSWHSPLHCHYNTTWNVITLRKALEKFYPALREIKAQRLQGQSCINRKGN